MSDQVDSLMPAPVQICKTGRKSNVYFMNEQLITYVGNRLRRVALSDLHLVFHPGVIILPTSGADAQLGRFRRAS